MTDSAIPGKTLLLTVSEAEQGMKLLRFLERRLEGKAPRSMLHKWIRTGQVRVNKRRAGSYDVLTVGDAVRVPPFAWARSFEAVAGQGGENGPALQERLGEDLPVLAATADYLVLAKPAGLAAQPGPGIHDSVADRLRRAFMEAAYIPAPAHRLDRDTSGIVLAGLNHAAQRRLHELFSANRVRKLYLAWVSGLWPYEEPFFLCDSLRVIRESSGYEKITAAPGGKSVPLSTLTDPTAGEGDARSMVFPLSMVRSGKATAMRGSAPGRTLLLVRLLTGRKHQIRVQLASRGFPIIGDTRYGGAGFQRLLLHAFAVSLPRTERQSVDPEWRLPPDWPDGFNPESACLARAFDLRTV